MTQPTHPHLSDEPAVQINGAPATAHSLLAALLDIYDDAQNNAPENRCYIDSAWSDVLKEARQFLATPPAAAEAPAVPSDALSDFLEAQDALDNHELNGKNGTDYFTLIRRRNDARKDLDAAFAAQPKADTAGSMSGILESVVESIRQGVADSTEPKAAYRGIMSLQDCADAESPSPVNPASVQAGEVSDLQAAAQATIAVLSSLKGVKMTLKQSAEVCTVKNWLTDALRGIVSPTKGDKA
jgi:hypothetical protein